MPQTKTQDYVKVYSSLDERDLNTIGNIVDRWGIKEQEVLRTLLILGFRRDDVRKKVEFLRQEENAKVYFRIPAGIHAYIKSRAEKASVSLSDVIRYFIELGLQSW